MSQNSKHDLGRVGGGMSTELDPRMTTSWGRGRAGEAGALASSGTTSTTSTAPWAPRAAPSSWPSSWTRRRPCCTSQGPNSIEIFRLKFLATGWHICLLKTSHRIGSDSSGSWWAAAAVATYCPGRMTEYPKAESTGGFPRPLGPKAGDHIDKLHEFAVKKGRGKYNPNIL